MAGLSFKTSTNSLRTQTNQAKLVLSKKLYSGGSTLENYFIFLEKAAADYMAVQWIN